MEVWRFEAVYAWGETKEHNKQAELLSQMKEQLMPGRSGYLGNYLDDPAKHTSSVKQNI